MFLHRPAEAQVRQSPRLDQRGRRLLLKTKLSATNLQKLIEIKELKKAIEGDRHTEKGREGQNSFVMQIMYQDVPVAKFPN